MIVRDLAICLRRMEYSQTSQILTLFCRQSGQLRAIARGARRPKSAFGGGVEPLTLGEILFSSSGRSELVNLREWTVTESFPQLRESLPAINCGFYAAEMLQKLTEPMDANPHAFDAMHRLLRRLCEGARPLIALLQFQLALLQAVGLLPNLQNCGKCRRPPRGEELFFSFPHASVYCRNCPPSGRDRRKLNPAVLQLLLRLLADEHGQTRRSDAWAAFELLDDHVAYQLARPLRCSRMIRQLQRVVFGNDRGPRSGLSSPPPAV